jgi:RHS repeat-associated protein
MIIGENETVDQPFKYVGQFGVMAEPDNLYYMKARYYDADTGRFISEDPIGFEGGINLYAYCLNNPILFIDPFGLRWFGGGDDGKWTIGRDGSIVEPGPNGFGATLETYGPAMETMSEIHDPMVGALVPDIPVVNVIVDTAVNIPTMPVAYGAAIVYETGSSIVDILGGGNENEGSCQ